jgi:hypothetical protein
VEGEEQWEEREYAEKEGRVGIDEKAKSRENR